MMIKHIDSLKRMKPRKGLKFRFLYGDEAARAHAEDKRSRQLYRLPPEEYTRILLAAKEGAIKPGEADRRIARGGGHSAVRPLPRPPD